MISKCVSVSPKENPTKSLALAQLSTAVTNCKGFLSFFPAILEVFEVGIFVVLIKSFLLVLKPEVPFKISYSRFQFQKEELLEKKKYVINESLQLDIYILISQFIVITVIVTYGNTEAQVTCLGTINI